MRFKSKQGGVLLFLAALAAFGVGCGQTDSKSGQSNEKDTKGKQTQLAQAKQGDKKVHDHSSWWCDEHGVPEAECSQCSAKAAAEFKKKGDWCEKHDRAKSQCFLCEPKLKEKYAAIYRAKYGKEPPPMEDEEKAKQDDLGPERSGPANRQR